MVLGGIVIRVKGVAGMVCREELKRVVDTYGIKIVNTGDQQGIEIMEEPDRENLAFILQYRKEIIAFLKERRRAEIAHKGLTAVGSAKEEERKPKTMAVIYKGEALEERELCCVEKDKEGRYKVVRKVRGTGIKAPEREPDKVYVAGKVVMWLLDDMEILALAREQKKIQENLKDYYTGKQTSNPIQHFKEHIQKEQENNIGLFDHFFMQYLKKTAEQGAKQSKKSDKEYIQSIVKQLKRAVELEVEKITKARESEVATLYNMYLIEYFRKAIKIEEQKKEKDKMLIATLEQVIEEEQVEEEQTDKVEKGCKCGKTCRKTKKCRFIVSIENTRGKNDKQK